MPRLTESNPAISDPISPTGTVDVKPSLVDRIKAEAFWDKLASIDSQYTQSYLIEHGVTRAAVEEIFSLESDFTDGRITYYEFDRALDSRLFLSKLPKILARFRQTLYESCRTPNSPDFPDEITEFCGMHREAINDGQRTLLTMIQREFYRFRMEKQITPELLQSCLVLAKYNQIPLTHLAAKALFVANELAYPTKPPHPHFKQLVLWIKENLTPEQLVLIGFENNITPFFLNELTNHDAQ